MIVTEVSRKNLVGKSKLQSPARYNKRLRYSTMSIPEIDGDKLLNDDFLVIYVDVGNYTVTVAYKGVINRLIDIIAKSNTKSLNRKNVVRAMNEQIDLTDVYVNCQCSDFKYRYNFYASQHDYKYGPKETRPAKITNPQDNIGAVCKHLLCVLANKKWLVKAAAVVNEYIHDNYNAFLEAYNLSEDQFFYDEQAYQKAIKSAVKREKVSLPPELNAAVNKKFDADNLELELSNLLDRRGYLINVDYDLDIPISVSISKDSNAFVNPENAKLPIYTFDVISVGSKIALDRNLVALATSK